MKAQSIRAASFLFSIALVVAGCDSEGSATPSGGSAGSGGTDVDATSQAGSGGASTPDTGVSPDTGVTQKDGSEDAPVDAPPSCDPPAVAGSFYVLSAVSKQLGEPVSMCEFRGKVVLLSNVAAKCGFTPQLGTLAAVDSTYKDAGLVVLGFYCNQFGQQAGSDAEQTACEKSYGASFPLFETVNVNPPNEHPIFSWIKAQPGGAGPISWNFEKFLISRKGQLLGRWPSAVEPDSAELTTAIETALAQTP